MADYTLSQLDAITTPADTDLLHVRNASGIDKKITVGNFNKPVTDVVNVIKKGFIDVTLTEWSQSNQTKPQVAAGSVFEQNGSIVEVSSNQTIDSSVVADYIPSTVYLVYNNTNQTYAFTKTSPTWDSTKNGWYVGSYRCLNVQMRFNGSVLYPSYLGKKRFAENTKWGNRIFVTPKGVELTFGIPDMSIFRAATQYNASNYTARGGCISDNSWYATTLRNIYLFWGVVASTYYYYNPAIVGAGTAGASGGTNPAGMYSYTVRRPYDFTGNTNSIWSTDDTNNLLVSTGGSIASPAGGPRGITSDGTNLIVSDVNNNIYVMTGITTTILRTLTPVGLTGVLDIEYRDGFIYCCNNTQYIYVVDYITGEVVAILDTNWASIVGVTFAGDHLVVWQGTRDVRVFGRDANIYDTTTYPNNTSFVPPVGP